jgi:hypothetical protein
MMVHGCLDRLHSGVPVDQSEWAASMGAVRDGNAPRMEAASAMDQRAAVLTQGGERAARKPQQGKGGQRRSAARKHLTDDQLAAGLDDARRLLGDGALGNPLVGTSGDVL